MRRSAIRVNTEHRERSCVFCTHESSSVCNAVQTFTAATVGNGLTALHPPTTHRPGNVTGTPHSANTSLQPMAVTPSLKQAPRGPPSGADQARVLGHADFASRPEPSTGTPAPPESTDPAPDPAFGASRPVPGGTFGPGVSIYSPDTMAGEIERRLPSNHRASTKWQPIHQRRGGSSRCTSASALSS
jgi:hypothetical protein